MYNAFTNTSITTTVSDTSRSAAHCYNVLYSGLRPFTKHKMYLDGEDYTWACRGYGQTLGEDLMSDDYGNIHVKIHYEIPFSRPSEYEMKDTQSVSYYTERANKSNGRMDDNIQIYWKTFQVRSADGLSLADAHFHFHICLTQSKYNTIEQNE